MSKAFAPLFSLRAHGDISNALCFQTWKNLNVVSKASQPTDPRTSSQISHRDLYRYFSSVWKEIDYTDDDKQAYRTSARIYKLRLNTYSYFLRICFALHKYGYPLFFFYNFRTSYVSPGTIKFQCNIIPDHPVSVFYSQSISRPYVFVGYLSSVSPGYYEKEISGFQPGLNYFFSPTTASVPPRFHFYSGLYRFFLEA